MDVRILWVEGKRTVNPSLIPGLRKKGFEIQTVATGREAIKNLKKIDPDLVVLNAASMRTTGTRICQSLRSLKNGLPILLIADPDNQPPEDVCANVVLVLPFTTRKVVNRIRHLLPGDDKNVVRAGSIRLDVERKQVRCKGRQAVLTPRLVQLLRIFMDHPGEALDREDLFREVWNTEYTGDTRTLDVHISWLRQAIEQDPREPQHIKTIRGVGYRLDI